MIDLDEYEYVLSEFGISEKVAKQAYTIFTEVRRSDMFTELWYEMAGCAVFPVLCSSKLMNFRQVFFFSFLFAATACSHLSH